ncbi:ribonuclease R [Kushneria phosphatilytica]|uniref:Ribonuclease R n=1 Tax=Kushneria phosphatilytica TaxID=657387 RepID=A0A5C0ZYU1_9GAMM|nr:ribonuclease R [Kushneria phosphatilytica]QEL10553.1 ribonuclease R [Kushneria phosphatilytica]
MSQWNTGDDPQAAREASRYENPVPSREYLLEQLVDYGKPISAENMCRRLGIEDEEQQEAVRRRLNAMARDGQAIGTRDGSFEAIDPSSLIDGRVVGHRDGIGFMVRDDKVKPDLVIPPRQMRRLFDGDRIRARISGRDRRGRDEISINEILERRTQQLVGLYRERGPDIGVLVPENNRIAHEVMIPAGSEAGAKDGQVVMVRITEQPELRQQPMGEVIEVLGERMDPGMEIDIAIRQHDLPEAFPEEVLDQIRHMSEEVREEDKGARVDLRDWPLVTIDGEDARDFDDAVYAWKTKSGGWKLVVAIADVSHYVPAGSALDEEAYSRGNSVYFPGQVVPMLPELLSNGLCSLNPDVDRLCMVCEMNISQQGAISRYKFYEGIMRSKARLTYTKVGTMLEDADSEAGQALRREHASLVKPLEALHGLYQTLRQARSVRGAIDFETTETQIVFNDQRKIERIVPRVRNDAHKLIEECMLAANVATARFLDKHKLPALYRVHARPAEERLDNLRVFLGELGLTLDGSGENGEPTPSDFQRLREAISDRPDADIIQMVMLRTMTQAIYTPYNEGHFGLAYPAYAHFTSPIRRYPDLLVHRAIRSVIRSNRNSGHVERLADTPIDKPQRWCPYTFEQMIELGEHCSMTERRADDATRDVEDWLKCEFMSDKVGDIFEGSIASVTQFGLFVRLDEHFVEGLVHISSLPSDYYQYEAERHQLKGDRGGLTYRLGDGVTVQVARVDLDQRRIDFELTEAQPRSRRRVRKKPGASPEGVSESTDKPEEKKKPRKRKSRPGKRERERNRRSGHEAAQHEGSSAKGEKTAKSRDGKKPAASAKSKRKGETSGSGNKRSDGKRS